MLSSVDFVLTVVGTLSLIKLLKVRDFRNRYLWILIKELDTGKHNLVFHPHPCSYVIVLKAGRSCPSSSQ